MNEQQPVQQANTKRRKREATSSPENTRDTPRTMQAPIVSKIIKKIEDKELQKKLRIAGILPSNQTVKPNLNRARIRTTSAGSSGAASTSSAGTRGPTNRPQAMKKPELPRPQTVLTDPDGWKTVRSKPSPSKNASKKPINKTANTSVAQGTKITDRHNSLATQSADTVDLTADESASPHIDKATKQKPPPIHVINTNLKQLISDLKTWTNNDKSFFLRTNNNIDRTTIYTTDIDNYNKIIENLRTNDTKHYTYTPKQYKPKVMVLKGVHGDFDEIDVKNDLEAINTPGIKFIKITKAKLGRNAQTLFFLAHITSESNLTLLKDIKAVLHQKVSWEPLRKNGLHQCKKCQMLGHASINCGLPYTCVKCGGNHDPGSCPIEPGAGKEFLKCANCGMNGHPASYKGCPYYKQATSILNNLKKEKRNANIEKLNRMSNAIQTNKYTVPNITYADTLRNSTQSIPRQLPTPIDNTQTRLGPIGHIQINPPQLNTPDWIEEIKKTLTVTMTTLINDFRQEIFAHINNTIEQRLDVLFNRYTSDAYAHADRYGP